MNTSKINEINDRLMFWHSKYELPEHAQHIIFTTDKIYECMPIRIRFKFNGILYYLGTYYDKIKCAYIQTHSTESFKNLIILGIYNVAYDRIEYSSANRLYMFDNVVEKWIYLTDRNKIYLNKIDNYIM